MLQYEHVLVVPKPIVGRAVRDAGDRLPEVEVPATVDELHVQLRAAVFGDLHRDRSPAVVAPQLGLVPTHANPGALAGLLHRAQLVAEPPRAILGRHLGWRRVGLGGFGLAEQKVEQTHARTISAMRYSPLP